MNDDRTAVDRALGNLAVPWENAAHSQELERRIIDMAIGRPAAPHRPRRPAVWLAAAAGFTTLAGALAITTSPELRRFVAIDAASRDHNTDAPPSDPTSLASATTVSPATDRAAATPTSDLLSPTAPANRTTPNTRRAAPTLASDDASSALAHATLPGDRPVGHHTSTRPADPNLPAKHIKVVTIERNARATPGEHPKEISVQGHWLVADTDAHIALPRDTDLTHVLDVHDPMLLAETTPNEGTTDILVALTADASNEHERAVEMIGTELRLSLVAAIQGDTLLAQPSSPDRDGDGVLTGADVGAFVQQYMTGDADYDLNGITDVADFASFMQGYVSGEIPEPALTSGHFVIRHAIMLDLESRLAPDRFELKLDPAHTLQWQQQTTDFHERLRRRVIQLEPTPKPADE